MTYGINQEARQYQGESGGTKQDYCVPCDRLTLHIETEGDGWVHHGCLDCRSGHTHNLKDNFRDGEVDSEA